MCTGTVHTYMRILFNLALLYLTHVMQTVLICNLFGILVCMRQFLLNIKFNFTFILFFGVRRAIDIELL